MMAASITLRVLTEAGVAFEDEAVSIIAPGELGYLGFLANHAPLVTTVQPGNFIWRRPNGETQTVHVSAGLLEIAKNHLTILTHSVERPRPSPQTD